MTGLEVVEVNITVSDVHLPSDDSADEPAKPAAAPRVARPLRSPRSSRPT